MNIHVKACELGESVMVLDDGRTILGELGNVALIIEDPDRQQTATVALSADEAWALAVKLGRESRKARASVTLNAPVRLRDILFGRTR